MYCIIRDHGGEYETAKNDELVVLAEKRGESLPGAIISI